MIFETEMGVVLYKIYGIEDRGIRYILFARTKPLKFKDHDKWENVWIGRYYLPL